MTTSDTRDDSLVSVQGETVREYEDKTRENVKVYHFQVHIQVLVVIHKRYNLFIVTHHCFCPSPHYTEYKIILFHQGSSKAGSESVPNLDPVLHVPIARELALGQENCFQSGTNSLVV